jgi:hypothetical protein
MTDNRMAEHLAWSVYFQLRYSQTMSVQALTSGAMVLETAAGLLADDYYDETARADTLACVAALRAVVEGYGDQTLEQAANTMVDASVYGQYASLLYWL